MTSNCSKQKVIGSFVWFTTITSKFTHVCQYKTLSTSLHHFVIPLRFIRQRKQNTEHLTEYLHHTRYINSKQAYDIEQHIGQVEHDNGEVDKDVLINLGVHRGTAEILEQLMEQIEAGDFE